MKRWTIVACALVAVLAWAGVAQAGAKRQVSLNFYRATVSQAKYQKMLAKDVDIAAATTRGKKVTLQMVLTQGQVRALRGQGVTVKAIRNSKGQTARQAAAAQMSSGFNVWRDYDGPDGLRAWMYDTAKTEPATRQARGHRPHRPGPRDHRAQADPGREGSAGRDSRPAVLYSATQHAREWIAPEVDRRLLQWFIDEWRANDKPIKDMLKQRELWFVLVVNPDGYQYTFQSPGHAPLAQEPAGQQRDGTSGRRRRRPEPQLRPSTGTTTTKAPRRRSVERHLPWALSEAPSPRRTAIEGSVQPHRLQAAGRTTTPSGRGSSIRRAGRSARRPATTRSSTRSAGNRDNPAIPGFVPGPLVRRPVRDERRDDRLRVQPAGNYLVHARAERRLHGLRVRLPGRRGARAGRVPEDLAFNLDLAQVGGRSRPSGLAPRDHDEALLFEERRHVQVRPSRGELHVPLLLRRPAAGAGARASEPRCRLRQSSR